MYRKYTVNCRDEKVKIIDYMTDFLGFSSRKSKKLLKERKLLVNGKTGYRDKKLKDGDVLEIDLTEEPRQDVLAENIPLSVVYEDDFMLALNKPPFMLVHPTPNHPQGTLLNAVSYYFKSRGEQISLRLLNRLDMNTSGLVIIPKTSEVHNILGAMMGEGRIKKYYTAVIEGVMSPDRGIIDKPIGKDPENEIKRKVTEEGKTAVTIYETLEVLNGYSVLKLELVTGRTHQIRVHLSSAGHPIVGDSLYGRVTDLIGRQALHASDMELPHPVSGLKLKLHSDLSDDIIELINKLKSE